MSVRDSSEIYVAVIDGHDVVHAGIHTWLAGTWPPVRVVGNFTHPDGFASAGPGLKPKVDIVLFELQYDGHGPKFDALRRLCQAGHRVIVYSYLVSDEVILASLDMGAISYVAKSESGDHLREAIYAACTETPYVAPRTAEALLKEKTTGRPRLSLREREVLAAWCRLENKDLVARRLYIERSTVRTHLQRVRTKYAAVGRPAPTKASLIARAIQDGILGVDEL
jgi:DNA-binding NarL/FixJ family response regulator